MSLDNKHYPSKNPEEYPKGSLLRMKREAIALEILKDDRVGEPFSLQIGDILFVKKAFCKKTFHISKKNAEIADYKAVEVRTLFHQKTGKICNKFNLNIDELMEPVSISERVL